MPLVLSSLHTKFNGVTENAGVENAISQYCRGGKCRSGKSRSKPVWKAKLRINRVAAHILNVIQQSAVHDALHQCFLLDADAARRAGPPEAAGT